MTRNKTYIRGAVAVLGAVALTALALPAMAATDDIEGFKGWFFDDDDKEAGVDPATDGDLVYFYTEHSNDSANLQQNVVINDYMEDGLEYVAGSTTATVVNFLATVWSYANPDNGDSSVTNAVAKDALLEIDEDGDNDGTRYSSPGVNTGQGNGWVGPWYEENDAAADETAGVVQSYGGAGGLGDNNSISFTGPVAAPADDEATTGPAIVRQFNASGWFDLQLIFQTNGAQLDASVEDPAAYDTLGVWISDDGTAWTHVATLDPGAANASRVLDIGSLAGDSSAYIRVGPNSDLESGEIWGVDNFIIAGAKAQYNYYDNIPGGHPSLQPGVPPTLVTAVDAIHLNPVVNFNGETYYSVIQMYYGATVDTSATFDFDTYLTNELAWRSDSYGMDGDDPAFNYTGTGIDVLYEPEIDITVTSNSPVQVGQPIIITVVFTHGDDSDGSPVCVDGGGVTLPPGFTVVNDVASGGDADLCLEEGETWTFTLTYPPRATAGTVPFAAAFAGYSVNAGQEDPVDVSVNASTDVVVVLAATGPANGGLAGLSAALMALGATALVVARRRNA